MIIGLISDTHGCLPDAACSALEGCDAIVHAGDIGASSILWCLEAIAPVTAVLGNCDYNDFGPAVRKTAYPVFEGLRFMVVHRPPSPYQVDPRIDIVVHGHTHRRRDELVAGIRYFNPGSATEPRDGKLASVLRLTVVDGMVRGVGFIDLS